MEDFIPSSQLSPAGVDDYMKVYNATLKMLAESFALFDSLAESSPDEGDREKFMMKALEAKRAKAMLESKLDAFVEGTSLVRRPSPEEIEAAQGLARRLAELAAAHAQAQALLNIVSDGVEVFNNVTA